MKELSTPTRKSPKNKFFAHIYFSQPIDEIGSVTSLGAMTIESVQDLAEQEARRIVAGTKVTAEIEIRENKKDYPSFEWVTVKKYQL